MIYREVEEELSSHKRSYWSFWITFLILCHTSFLDVAPNLDAVAVSTFRLRVVNCLAFFSFDSVFCKALLPRVYEVESDEKNYSSVIEQWTGPPLLSDITSSFLSSSAPIKTKEW